MSKAVRLAALSVLLLVGAPRAGAAPLPPPASAGPPPPGTQKSSPSQTLPLPGSAAPKTVAPGVRPVQPSDCPPPAALDPDSAGLPHFSAALKPGATLTILAIGGAADAKSHPAGAVSASADFFGQFGRDLSASLPETHVAVAQKGGRGRLAVDQLRLLRAALKAHRYALVLWQTGTLDAVQGEPIEDFSDALAQGADAAEAAGADLVLIEPQYSHFLEANADPGPYLSSMEALGAEHGTLVFRRYAIMEDWEDNGLIDLEHAPVAARPAVAMRLHACLAAELTRAVLAEARARAPGR